MSSEALLVLLLGLWRQIHPRHYAVLPEWLEYHIGFSIQNHLDWIDVEVPVPLPFQMNGLRQQDHDYVEYPIPIDDLQVLLDSKHFSDHLLLEALNRFEEFHQGHQLVAHPMISTVLSEQRLCR